MANKRPELTDIEIEDNGGKDLSAYDMKVGRKNTAEGNISGDKSPTVPSGTDINIADMIDFVNSYSEDAIQIDGKDRSARNSAGRRIARTEEGLRAFYDWFGDSKVVDEKGQPLVVYHGTHAKFAVFDKGKFKSNTGMNSLGDGFYFTDSLKKAEKYAYGFTGKGRGVGENNIMEVYLNIKNPAYGVRNFDPDIHDGIIETSPRTGAKIYLVFEPNQIKSVDNRGTFSPESDNIYYQLGGENAQIANVDKYSISDLERKL